MIKHSFVAFFFFAILSEWVGACGVYRFFFILLHTYCQWYTVYNKYTCFIKVQLEYVAFERVEDFMLFFPILFFYLTKAVIKNMQAVFCGYLMQAYTWVDIFIRNHNVSTLFNIKDLFLYFGI